MIAKISRGWKAGGLLSYLMGPGRFNEHTNQRVVATWDGAPGLHQPLVRAKGGFDLSDLTAALTDPAVAAGVSQQAPKAQEGDRRVPRGPVWHCSLRNHAEDRELSDAEWAAVVEDLMDRTGISPHGDTGACRWVAVRHAADHVHIAAVLVRQDTGKRVHPRNDFHVARQVCRDAEQRLGLGETPAADRTAAERSTRAEQEKAIRRDKDEPSRDWLHRAVRVAAVQAQDPEHFFRRLADLGVLVRPREDPPGQLVGYSVAAPGDVNSAGLPVWFSGRAMARDLSLPALLERWASAPPATDPIAPAPGERTQVGREETSAAIAEATSAVEYATEAVAAGEDGDVSGIVHSTGDMVTTVSTVTERALGRRGQTVGDAAELFDRAARAAGVGLPSRWSPIASQLRSASWRLMATRSVNPRGNDDSGIAELVLALAALAAEIAAYHEQKQCLAQASAARRCASSLLRTGAGTRPGGTTAGPRRDQGGPDRSGGAELPRRPRTTGVEIGGGPAVGGLPPSSRDRDKRGRGR